MAGAQVALSALPSSGIIASSEVGVFVIGGTTKKITAGALRTAMFAFAGTDPINTGPITAVGNSTITGTLSGITTQTLATLQVTSSITIAPASAATLTINTTAGAATDNIAVLLQRGGVTKWRIGTNISGTNNDMLEVYNDAGGGSAIQIANTTKIVTLSSGLVVSAGGANVGALTATTGVFTSNITCNGGTLNFSNFVGLSKIVGGSGGTAVRNNADSADNITITDAGLVTVRTGLVVTAGGAAIAGSVGITGIGAVLNIATIQVVGPRATGWTVQTTAQTRADMGAAPTLATTYTTLAALIADLRAHGLIGT